MGILSQSDAIVQHQSASTTKTATIHKSAYRSFHGIDTNTMVDTKEK
jgi:hypothetical protein